MKAKIYLSYFNDSQKIENNILTPIQVGASISSLNLDMIKDNVGDNISDRNPYYCEMTGVYWAWKNDKSSDYIGSCHYRRVFDFKLNKIRKQDKWGTVVYHGVDSNLYEEFGLDEVTIKQILAQYDAIIPEGFNVNVANAKNLYEHYITAPFHFQKDIDLTLDVVARRDPKFFPYFKKHLEGNIMYATNVFILKRNLFLDLCNWLFPILEELYQTIDTSEYNVQEKRVIGYISERLISAYISKNFIENKKVKYHEARRVFISSTKKMPNEPALPKTDKKVLTLAIASDKNYVGHLGSLVASILDNHDDRLFLDILILDGGLNSIEHKLLNSIIKYDLNRARLSFISMKGMFEEIAMHSHFTVPTLYRLYLPEILHNRDKVLYLDTDMTVVDSLEELYNVDIDDVYVAAVRDIIMRTFVHNKVPSHQPSGGIPAEDYLVNYVGMGNQNRAASYFQAGTILFNLKKMREDGLSGKMIDDLIHKQYWFLDQDILNKYLGRKVRIVDNRWNVVYIPEEPLKILQGLELEEYHNSHVNPAIIHYAGTDKPWINANNPHSHYYWNYLRRTPWYETMLFWYVDANKKRETIIEHVYSIPKTKDIIDVYKRRTKKTMKDLSLTLFNKIKK